MPAFKDLTGKTFSRLTVLERAANKSRRVKWRCVCTCGNETVVAANKLANGHTQSCGCLHKERSSEANIKHGQSSYPNGGASTKEYNTWTLMKRRCEKSTTKTYELYGGRGIYVCARWQTFENFFTDMGHAPSPKHSIDRIDVNGPYSPENCRWADNKTQGRNKRNNRNLTIRGVTQCLAAWADAVAISQKILHARLTRGWPPEKAVFTPVKRR